MQKLWLLPCTLTVHVVESEQEEQAQEQEQQEKTDISTLYFPLTGEA